MGSRKRHKLQLYTNREKQKNQGVKSTCKVCRAWSPEEKLQVLGSSKRHQFETKRLEILAKLYTFRVDNQCPSRENSVTKNQVKHH